jgi:hypothetical protein
MSRNSAEVAVVDGPDSAEGACSMAWTADAAGVWKTGGDVVFGFRCDNSRVNIRAVRNQGRRRADESEWGWIVEALDDAGLRLSMPYGATAACLHGRIVIGVPTMGQELIALVRLRRDGAALVPDGVARFEPFANSTPLFIQQTAIGTLLTNRRGGISIMADEWPIREVAQVRTTAFGFGCFIVPVRDRLCSGTDDGWVCASVADGATERGRCPPRR